MPLHDLAHLGVEPILCRMLFDRQVCCRITHVVISLMACKK
jgi:hypothetical protein